MVGMETENPYPVQRETVKNRKEGDEVTLFFEVYMDKSFKERVKSQLISSAKLYFEHLVCNDYWQCQEFCVNSTSCQSSYQSNNVCFL